MKASKSNQKRLNEAYACVTNAKVLLEEVRRDLTEEDSEALAEYTRAYDSVLETLEAAMKSLCMVVCDESLRRS